MNWLELKEYNKQYRIDNRERINFTTQQWAENNQDKIKATRAKYKAKHPDYQEKLNAYKQKQRRLRNDRE